MNFTKQPINEIKKPMNNDFLEIRNAEGMPALVDSTIVMDFLMSIKTGIRNSALALTEIEDSEARVAVRGLLIESISLHAEVTDLMITKGWLHPYDINEQIKIDLISSQTAMQIAKLDLFPKDTSRLGTFATPNY